MDSSELGGLVEIGEDDQESNGLFSRGLINRDWKDN